MKNLLAVLFFHILVLNVFSAENPNEISDAVWTDGWRIAVGNKIYSKVDDHWKEIETAPGKIGSFIWKTGWHISIEDTIFSKVGKRWKKMAVAPGIISGFTWKM